MYSIIEIGISNHNFGYLFLVIYSYPMKQFTAYPKYRTNHVSYPHEDSHHLYLGVEWNAKGRTKANSMWNQLHLHEYSTQK